MIAVTGGAPQEARRETYPARYFGPG